LRFWFAGIGLISIIRLIKICRATSNLKAIAMKQKKNESFLFFLFHKDGVITLGTHIHLFLLIVYIIFHDCMMNCIFNARTSRYLPKNLASTTENYETEHFHYDHSTNSLDCKLLTKNPYNSYFEEVYPKIINEHELNDDMLNVIKSYTNSISNECYIKTNLNLLSANMNDIDWIYVNKLRSLIRGLNQSNIKPIYYRGLTLSDTEIKYYIEKRNNYYYTNSFLSFTIDRLLIYPGNAILILKTENSNEQAKKNIANIWKWSACTEEKEALLAVGTRLKIISVHYFGYKWEIELELSEDDVEFDDNE